MREHADPAVLRTGLLAVVLVAAPLTLLLDAGGRPRGESYDTELWWFVSDIPLAALMVAAAISQLARGAPRPPARWGRRLLAAVAAISAVALIAHPSMRGVAQVFRIAGALAVAAVIAEAVERDAWRVVLAVVAGSQTVLAIAQVALGGAVGLAFLGESADPFYPVGDTRAPSGTVLHPYVLAGFALVAGGVLAARSARTGSVGWALAASIAVAPVAFTYSRAGAAGAALLVAGLATGLWRHARLYAPAVVAIALTLAGGAVLARDGWTSRVTQTTSATTEADLTTDRGELIGDAVVMIADQPLLGVGPGLYVSELPAAATKKPVHVVALLVAAEAGVFAGLAVLGMIVAVAMRRQIAPVAVAAWGAFLPQLFLDHFAYTFPVGLVVLGVWIGHLDSDHPRATESPSSSDAELVHLA